MAVADLEKEVVRSNYRRIFRTVAPIFAYDYSNPTRLVHTDPEMQKLQSFLGVEIRNGETAVDCAIRLLSQRKRKSRI